jgi:hypothetical protein
MTSTAGWAETPEFAGELHQMFKSAAAALYPKKTMHEHSASKVLTKFIVDERW